MGNFSSKIDKNLKKCNFGPGNLENLEFWAWQKLKKKCNFGPEILKIDQKLTKNGPKMDQKLTKNCLIFKFWRQN